MSLHRPRALLLDVNGTLFPASSAAPVFEELGLDPQGVELWFARVLRDAFAAQLSGAFHPFPDWAAHHLAPLLAAAGNPQGVLPEDAAQRVMRAWAHADLYPDVAPALTALKAQGIQPAVLTNGSAQGIARSVLARGRALQAVDPWLLDISGPSAWKPAAASYQYALTELGMEPHQVMMVASHPWDCHGALRAGLLAAYVQREGGEGYPPFLALQPQLVVRGFDELEQRLAALPAGGE